MPPFAVEMGRWLGSRQLLGVRCHMLAVAVDQRLTGATRHQRATAPQSPESLHSPRDLGDLYKDREPSPAEQLTYEPPAIMCAPFM